MFCKGCGQIISADTKFCPNCGCNNSASVQNHSQYPKKTKSEFISQYHKQHQGYYVSLVCNILFIVVGAIIALMNLDNISTITSKYASDASKMEAFCPFIFTLVFWCIASILMAVAKSCDRVAQAEYERYISDFSYQNQSISSNTNSFSSINPIYNSNEWLCPNCGRRNQKYVGTCGCGEERPK